MFAEHDLSLTGEPCAVALCLRVAIGVGSDLGGEPRGWLQLDLTPVIDRATWVRPANTFIFAVDTNVPEALEVMHRLTDQLTAADQASIVVGGRPLRPAINGASHDELHAAIDQLAPAGPPSQSALELALELGEEVHGQGRKVRVIQLAASLPPFPDLDTETRIAEAADHGVELTTLLFSGPLPPEHLEQVGRIRGRNAFRVTSVDAFMATEYPHFTSAIAYDLELEVAPGVELAADDEYGLPTSFRTQHRISIPSLFLSELEAEPRAVQMTSRWRRRPRPGSMTCRWR